MSFDWQTETRELNGHLSPVVSEAGHKQAFMREKNGQVSLDKLKQQVNYVEYVIVFRAPCDIGFQRYFVSSL